MPIDVTLMAPKARFIVVHYHIFKNAGTTVEEILEREFPGCFAKLHGPTPEATLDAEDLSAFLRDHPRVRAVTSHHLRYPLPSIRNTVVFDCCFLRDPLDRLDSVYTYLRRIEANDAAGRKARRQTPAEFVHQLLDGSPEQISNVQVIQLANRGAFTRPASENDLSRAVQLVRDMALPGVVEMFQESMVSAEYFLRPAFPAIRLDFVPRNVSRAIVLTAEDRERRLIERWGRDLHDHLVRMNELDIELLRQTSREIRRRLALVPEVYARMAEFGARMPEPVATTG